MIGMDICNVDEDITTLSIPSEVTRIFKFAFAGCTALPSVVLPEGIEEIQEYAFGTNLKTIVIPNSVTKIDYHAFQGHPTILCKKDSYAEEWAKIDDYHVVCIDNALLLPANLKSIDSEVFSGGTFESVIVPYSCTSIGSRAFANCSNLTYVCIPNSATTVASDAFEGCGDVVIDRDNE